MTTRKDEIGSISRNIVLMFDNLRSIVRQICRLLDQIFDRSKTAVLHLVHLIGIVPEILGITEVAHDQPVEFSNLIGAGRRAAHEFSRGPAAQEDRRGDTSDRAL